MGWAIQARNQWAAGQRGEDFTRVKTGRQSDTFQQFADTDEQTKLGKKTQVYHDSLNLMLVRRSLGQTIFGTAEHLDIGIMTAHLFPGDSHHKSTFS